MHQQLIDYINSRLSSPLTEQEVALVKETFVPKRFRKHQFFLQQGDVCKVAGFIVKGAFKQYTVDSTGKESVINLLIENWWVGDRESFTQETPTPFFIDALEECEVLLVNKHDFMEKLSEKRFIRQVIQMVTEKNAFQLLKRVQSTITLTAEQRFAELERNYPEFLQRFPQHLIASYLGMTKETLSRIRSNALKK